ncbi:MAG: DnaJ domain-containing protein [Thermoguttaceae bacterium]|nr:DnaJ domain-containing protein [Thermoguttaceae bacterium]MDW8038449.1 DnaJ C-terminal domain-containing protein [Thermoguttaceae bacterium]
MKDPYKVLGVRRDASQAEIQKAYRELARKYHPDLNPNDKDAKKKFQEVQAAFEILNDPEKRELYDRYGSAFETMGRGGPSPGGTYTYTWSSGPEGFGGLEDIFEQFFGDRFGTGVGGLGDLFEQFRRSTARAGTTTRTVRGQDIETEISIPFTTAVLGGEHELRVRHGSGRVETIRLKIPPGIEEGKKLRLKGQGEPGLGAAPPGDLLVTVHVEPHPCFQRRGNNLYVQVPISLGEAAAGTKIDIPTPKGPVALRIPPGISSGQKLRLAGYGVPAHGDQPAGDLYAEVLIVLPKNLSDSEVQMLRQIDQAHPQPALRSHLRW